jgi:hypothetical protein
MAHTGQFGSKTIKPEQVVLALMLMKEETVEWPHESKPGVMVKYQVRCCLRKDSCKDLCQGQRGRIEFQDGTGYTKPFQHMLACCVDKNCDQMIDQYWEAVVATSKFQSSLGFCSIASGKV